MRIHGHGDLQKTAGYSAGQQLDTERDREDIRSIYTIITEKMDKRKVYIAPAILGEVDT